MAVRSEAETNFVLRAWRLNISSIHLGLAASSQIDLVHHLFNVMYLCAETEPVAHSSHAGEDKISIVPRHFLARFEATEPFPGLDLSSDHESWSWLIQSFRES